MDITKIPAPEYAKQAERPVAAEYQRKAANEAANNLFDSFPWNDSAEGSKFWDGVFTRLKAISRGEPLK